MSKKCNGSEWSKCAFRQHVENEVAGLEAANRKASEEIVRLQHQLQITGGASVRDYMETEWKWWEQRILRAMNNAHYWNAECNRLKKANRKLRARLKAATTSGKKGTP